MSVSVYSTSVMLQRCARILRSDLGQRGASRVGVGKQINRSGEGESEVAHPGGVDPVVGKSRVIQLMRLRADHGQRMVVWAASAGHEFFCVHVGKGSANER